MQTARVEPKVQKGGGRERGREAVAGRGRHRQSIVGRPARRSEATREGGGGVPPLYEDLRRGKCPVGQVGGPEESSRGAAIGGAIEAPPDGVPDDAPAFDSQVSEALVEVSVQP